MKKALAVMFVLGISAAYAASSHHVTLYKATTINGTQLKAGDMKLELQGDKVVIKQGKTSVESNVTVQNGDHKFDASSVGFFGEPVEHVAEATVEQRLEISFWGAVSIELQEEVLTDRWSHIEPLFDPGRRRHIITSDLSAFDADHEAPAET